MPEGESVKQNLGQKLNFLQYVLHTSRKTAFPKVNHLCANVEMLRMLTVDLVRLYRDGSAVMLEMHDGYDH